jgi:putative ABC transport system substrate-binding protein
MNRREVITLLGGAAAWPVAGRAQQADRMRRIGVLINTDSPLSQERLHAFRSELQRLGWIEGRNIQLAIGLGDGSLARTRTLASGLLAQRPEVVLAVGSPTVALLQDLSPKLPVVFVTVVDPVGSGLVESMARPGGVTTGLVAFEYALSSKWIELLKEIAPGVTQAAVLRDPANPSGIGQFAAIQTVAPSLGIDLRTIDMRNATTVERIMDGFARVPGRGLIVTSAGSVARSDLVITLAAKHRLPAVYPFRAFPMGGGLISYGPDLVDQHRRAATYVDRILKGEKPADLPVQAPTKYELVINLKTAKALGLDVPATLLARADEVIE